MANSKANIYPIQLQGAELNLNKFDAEIKQYSGFNKNNSPFVGGCLSNLFIKDTEITGSDSENTYIDTNGDVYSVTAEGLFKNGDKVLDITGNAWEIEDLNLPDNTVYYTCSADYKTYVYVTSVQSDSFVELTFVYHSETEDYSITKTVSIPSNKYVYKINFDCLLERKYIGFSVVYVNETCDIGILDFADNSKYCFISTVTSLYRSFCFSTFIYQNEEHLIIHNLTTNTICYKWNGTNLNFNCIFHFTVPRPIVYTDFFAYSIPSEVFIQHYNNEFYCYRIHVDGQTYFNKKILKTKISEINVNEEESRVYVELVIDDNSFMTWVSTVGDVSGSFILSPLDQCIFENYGVCYAFMDSNKYWFFGVCDFVTGNVTLENNKPIFKMGALLDSCVLVNNSMVSGISLPGGNILATEWNSVGEDITVVFNGDEKVVAINYRDLNTNKLRQLKITDRYLLKKIDGLLVLNVNQIENCYRISDKKTLLFAPAWNNRAAKESAYCHSTPVTENVCYMASSVNEYNLADNASIILNPVPVVSKEVFVTKRTSSYLFNNFSKMIKQQKDVFINYYAGPSEINYLGSINVDNSKHFKYADLLGLPFPTDTNGNVMYSPSLFCDIKNVYGNKLFIKNENTYYPLVIGNNNISVMSFYLASGIDNLEEGFIIQGQFYGIINNGIYSIQYQNGVVSDISFIVDCTGLQFCGNSPYEALFYSKTNRCLYSFVGSNVLQQKQLVDKISSIDDYIYNPATQTIFLITDIGVIFYSIFGQFLYEKDIEKIFLLNNGVCFALGNTQYEYIKYYLEESNSDYTKLNVKLETCFYGVSNETVSVNDCLYIRLFSEEHEEGEIKISATTLANTGRKTEETTFKITSNDWDKMTHSLYLRYQPKTQRGLGISFSIDSPFKIASMSVGTQADAILIDKVSKGAINAPAIKSSNVAW